MYSSSLCVTVAIELVDHRHRLYKVDRWWCTVYVHVCAVSKQHGVLVTWDGHMHVYYMGELFSACVGRGTERERCSRRTRDSSQTTRKDHSKGECV